jgi:FtsH-binding integral membrane protein
MSAAPNPFGFGTAGRARPRDYAPPTVADASVVARFFNVVYAWMAVGLALTALVAVYVSQRPDWMARIFTPGVALGLFVVYIVLVMTISSAVRRISAPVATVLFMAYAALNGLLFSTLFLAYTRASLAGAFGVTAGTFAATSVYGMVTRRDLTRLGSFLFMGLIGLIIASVVNLFFASSMLYWLTTYAGVVIFVGLTAWDTQRLKEIARQTAGDAALANRLAISGALVLYLDFINLFIYLLRILGDRRN